MLVTEPIYTTKEDGTQVVTPPNRYLCIAQEGVTVYYQDGYFYNGLGEDAIGYDEVHDWFWDIIRVNYLESDVGRGFIKEIGLVLPEKRVLTKEENEASVVKKAAVLKKCDECGDMVLSSVLGLHIGRHTLARKAKERKSNLGEKNGGTEIK